ncbi:hypothetical protein CWC31_17350 [Pseudoalteromonas ruthenica]|uniref:hypothetical protein n=1 Tax=Pseudoalteromonas ruthenica TaxID=151081 RepID=UPI00110895A9|nr:hypothetical protein [Pseudoalteromonas ruthenica]TLX49308.1 hypothetical protein CWC31_17350 [Pseudoalteromonas ruthenica]
MKTLKLALAITTATFLTSSYAADYKLAVIDDNDTSKAVLAGQYDQVINLSNVTELDQQAAFEKSVNQCAAHIQVGKADEALSMCSLAIELISEIDVNANKRRELTAYAYGNRGIAHSLKNEYQAALDDFSAAYKTKRNTITRANLKTAQSSLKQLQGHVAP